MYVYLSFFWSEQKPLECYKWNVKALLLIIHSRNSLFSINDASVELKKNKNAFFDLKLQLKFLFLSFYFKIFLALKDNATRWEQIFLIKNQSLLRTQPLLSFKRNVLDSSVEIPYRCKCVMNPNKSVIGSIANLASVTYPYEQYIWQIRKRVNRTLSNRSESF